MSRRPQPTRSTPAPTDSATATATIEPPEAEVATDAEAPPCQPFADLGCGVCPECRRREARLFDDLLAAHLAAIERMIHPDAKGH